MIPCWTSTRLLVCIALGSALALGGGGNVSVAQTSSDSKPDLPVKPKEPEGKPKEMEGKPVEPRLKELEQKAKEAEPKVKETELKAKELEQKVKELEQRVKDLEPRPKETDEKSKEPDLKPKDAEPKPKDAEVKPKEPDTKAKDAEVKKEAEPRAKEAETKPKEPDAKPKEAGKTKEDEPKAKEPDGKPKEVEVVEQPCPGTPEGKPTVNGSPPAETPAEEKSRPAETDARKPLRSPMVTAKLALMADPRLFPYEIEVDTKDRDLVLLGKVGNDVEKRVAKEIVRCLEGVRAVENRLKVEPDASQGLVAERDKMITALVKERFEKSKTLVTVKFDVKTEGGVVTLSGSTRFQVIILEAAQAARQVPGVKAVNTDAVRLVAGD